MEGHDEIPFSDHEAVVSTFSLRHTDYEVVPSPPRPHRLTSGRSSQNMNTDVLQIAHEGFVQSSKDTLKSVDQWFYMLLIIVAIGLMSVLLMPCCVNVITIPVYFAALLSLFFHYFLVKRQEYHHLVELTHQIEDDIATRNALENECSDC